MDRGVGEVDVLLQVAYGIGFGNVNGAAVQAFLPKNHLEQGGLSATVSAYQAHPLVVAHKQARSVQKDLNSKGFGDILYLDHCNKDRKRCLYKKQSIQTECRKCIFDRK